MKKGILFLILLTSINSYCQNFNIPYRKGNLWGFADKNGKVVISPKYDSVDSRMENFRWKVYKNHKVGIINTAGEERLAVLYDSIEGNPVHSRYNEFYLYNEGKMGYADLNGKIILPLKYYHIEKTRDVNFNLEALFFLVKTNAQDNYCLIDKEEAVLLSGIEEFESDHRGFYKFKINSKWGVYSVPEKKWIIPAVYDTFKRFELEGQQPKKEFENIHHYAVKNKAYYLFSIEYLMIPSKLKKLSDFFELKKDSNRNVMEYMVHDDRGVEGHYESVCGEKFQEGNRYETNGIDWIDIKTIWIKKEGKLYGMVFSNGRTNIDYPAEFEDIQLLKSNYQNYYYKDFAMVKKHDKWAIYSINERKTIGPYEYDSFDFHIKYTDYLVLKKENQMGLFQIYGYRNREKPVFIAPEYDALKGYELLKSLDYNYDLFEVFYFSKKGEICPVGRNGISYYED